jgi:hypothetical protein
VYLVLVTIHKRLLAVDPAPPPPAHFVPDLEQLLRGCEGKLSPVKPLLDAALRVAQEKPRDDVGCGDVGARLDHQ